MKKAILICIFPFLFAGCILEDRDDCYALLRLTFHHQNTSEGFDNIIGNDIHAYLYRDDILYDSIIIPYEQIQNGKEYLLEKWFRGKLNIAAWAVPRIGGNADMIPETSTQEIFSSSVIGHKVLTRNTLSVCLPMDDLYLGTLESSTDLQEESRHIISMENTVCRTNIIIEPSGILEPLLTSGDPVVYISGISQYATLNLEPYGNEVAIFSSLQKDTEKNIYTTGFLGLMPSYEKKTITVTVFSGDNKLFMVDTEELSRPGTTIIIRITGSTADIIVNDWRVRTSNVIF